MGVPVIGLCYSALGETRSVKERPRTRPSRLYAGGSATSSLWNNGPTAIRGVHERTRLEITTVSNSGAVVGEQHWLGLAVVPDSLVQHSQSQRMVLALRTFN